MSEAKREAASALRIARRDLKNAQDAMHTARSRMESFMFGTDDFVNHQSDSGALWALSNQLHEMKRTIGRILRALDQQEKTK